MTPTSSDDRVHLRLGKEAMAQLERLCQLHDRTKSAQIRHMLLAESARQNEAVGKTTIARTVRDMDVEVPSPSRAKQYAAELDAAKQAKTETEGEVTP